MQVPYTDAWRIQDLLSSEGLNLSLDDDNAATGQWIYATVQASAGATTVSCQPLPCPMPAGNTLDFSGANMPQIVEAVLSSSASLGATSLAVAALPGQVNQGAVAIDGGVNAFELARIQAAINYASGRLNNYLLPRYQSAAALQSSQAVVDWATVIAARWLRKRRAQPCPQGIEDDYKEAMKEILMVAAGQLQLGDLGTPVPEWPAWSNCRVDPRYWYDKVRVQRNISEQSVPTGYSQQVDWGGELTIEL